MDEIQNLIFRVEGQEKLDQLNAALQKETDHLTNLINLNKANPAGINPGQIENSAKSVLNLTKEVENLERALNKAAGGGGAGINKLALTYALDDLLNTSGGLEAKIRSISNNVPGLLMQVFGANVPWLAAAATAGTVIAGVAGHWTQLRDAITGTDTKAAEEGLKKLEERAKALREAFKSLSEASAIPGEKPTGQDIATAFDMAGNLDRVSGKLANDLLGRTTETQAETDARLAAEAGVGAAGQLQGVDPAVAAQRRAEAQQRLQAVRQSTGQARRQRAQDEAQRLIVESRKPGQAGAAARARLKDLVQANSGNYPAELLTAMEGGSPEDQPGVMEQIEAEQTAAIQATGPFQGPPRSAALSEAQRNALNRQQAQAMGPPASAALLPHQRGQRAAAVGPPSSAALNVPQREAANARKAQEDARKAQEAMDDIEMQMMGLQGGAEQEAAYGFIGPVTQRLQQLAARMAQMERQNGGMARRLNGTMGGQAFSPLPTVW